MISININVIGMTGPGSELKPANFRFPDLPEREEGALLIKPPRLVKIKQYCDVVLMYLIYTTKCVKMMMLFECIFNLGLKMHKDYAA